MKFAWLLCLSGALAFAGNQDSEINVNSRYTVENVAVSANGWTADLSSAPDGKISSGLRKELISLIGQKLNLVQLDAAAKRLRKEFHARTVEHHVMRGANPQYVRVLFEVKLPPSRFEASIPKVLYNSVLGWSGAVQGTATVKQHVFTFGLVSDNDDLAERYTGVTARYENKKLGSDRVQFGLDFAAFHDQWDGVAQERAPAPLSDTSGLYRSREYVQPEVTFVLARPLTVSVGASFQSFQDEGPAGAFQAANAIVSTVRYHRALEDSENQADFDAAYSLRAATGALGSDFGYTRHEWVLRYKLSRGKSAVVEDFAGGLIAGRAPLFERFVLGNSTTLRGWNKYDLDPFGGSRMISNSVEYHYGLFEAFYDTGSIWDRADAAVLRHSAGIGLRQGAFSVAVAFPLGVGHIDPIFMVGMNY